MDAKYSDNVVWPAVVSVALLLSAGCGKNEKPPAAPPEVEVVQVVQQDVPIWKEWIGTLEGFVNAQIKPQVTGYLLRQTYKDGSSVKKGQLLFEIDPRTFQTAVDQSKGQLANSESQLAQAQANEVKTELDVKRFTPLAKELAIPQQDLDNAIQANEAAKAGVRAANAQIAAAKAQVSAAQLNLEFTRVTSLIDGIAGIAQAQIGDLVGPATLLTTVSTVDPIKVYFPVSERDYLNYVAEHPDPATRRVDLQLILANGTVYPHMGAFSLADRQVDVKTGTLRLQGIFPNPGGILRPGEFARIRGVTKTQKDALLIPQQAVSELQGSYQVMALGNDNKVEVRQVTVGERIGSNWIITSGLKAGEKVIAVGLQRVKPGMVVNPTPFTAIAGAQPAPSGPGR